jgi:hypothetical protein
MPKVIRRFRDINHNDHIYEEGDTYPAEGYEAEADRVSFLSKRHPTYGVAFLSAEVEKKDNAKKKTSTKK